VEISEPVIGAKAFIQYAAVHDFGRGYKHDRHFIALPRAAAPTAVNACFMTCPATESGIAAKGNGGTNLDEDTSSGVCTALNNKAP